ncbi:MAG: 5'-methylthioadenosine/adenosylhomocysteine nucleosidase [Campylobacteraceae bacterium]|jgi:adenosylhomocysteine/aminodeoxyfutalosine nucleosidase|nr:5'-methylthioadenosine/adenosylhomocysteine nucleosidase [Campylobacteraceae bacterium]MBT3882378.1 5'-methylthioadenosine/adenosylhomocysteine nucleosidase [Campylobacteraceae bacterium]MBT4031262.1 5'-methylthioadenosine/adenosylhomocysteine nucleosidase [Campylobacteraceae bacterium]MBT4178913.1 5'-methylthioadenosine/adenosylhomocysteine nucleosidase [Campylobacteraceae bacterium]MBT4573175.1 5'-methylthioadenosine/adenosylhomocysteine nucleosidase [Campylobacteraceae bacterium]
MTKLAIMGAMEEEIQPLLSYFTDIKVTEFANNRYYEVKYNDLDIVVAYSKIGKVFSTLTAATMIEKFACDTLLFSGVAGGINPELKIGDLIVANKLCQHDLDITAFGHPNGFVPGGDVFVKTDEKLKNIALDVANENNIKIIEGTIATGDQFVANETRKSFIENTFKADALEMEGASVAVVCDALNVPCLILRAISDTADMDAGFNFDEFLDSSAKNSANFLIKIINKINSH